MEASRFFEWGGYDLDGRNSFAEKRPGWPLPIHDVLVQHGVTIVFHGHDHFYAHQEREGIAYPLMPQPGHARGNTRSAAEYGYDEGDFIGSSGFLRVAVSPSAVQVFYLHTMADDPAQAEGRIHTIADRYSIER